MSSFGMPSMAPGGQEATRPPDQPKNGEHGDQVVPPQSFPQWSAPPRLPVLPSTQRSGESQAPIPSPNSSQQRQSPATSVTLPRLPAGTPAALLSSFSKGAYTAADATKQPQQPPQPSLAKSSRLAPGAHGPSHSTFVPLVSASRCADHDDSSSSTSLTDLSDEDDENEEDDEEGSDASTSRVARTCRGRPSWTAEDNNLLFRSAARHDNSWAMVAAELEAAGGRKRSLASVASQYHRLRRKGFVHVTESGASSSRSTPQRQDDGSSQRASSRRNAHLWTSDEKAFLLRVGDKYSAPDVTNKEASIYAEWKKRYPSSNLNPHAVFVYYHYMKRQMEEPARKKQRGNTTSAGSGPSATSELARPPPPRKAAPASFTQSFSQPIDSDSQRATRPKPKPWDAAEVQALQRIHRMFKTQQINWHGTSALYDTFKQIMPRSERTAGGVQAKYSALFEQGSSDDSDESGSGSEDCGEESDEGQEEENEAVGMLTPPELRLDLTTHRRGARRQSATTAPTTASPTSTSFKRQPPKDLPCVGNQSVLHHGQAAEPRHLPTSISHNQQIAPHSQYTAPPILDFSFTVQDNGMDFVNVPSDLGVAIYSRTSFKLLGPSQLDALAHALEASPHEQQQEALPAFAFRVLDGGGLEAIRSPEGTKTGIDMLRPGHGHQGCNDRYGVESRLVSACGFTIRVTTWL